jgi:hypothetical protein
MFKKAALLLVFAASYGIACKTITSPTVTTVAADCGAPEIRDLAAHLLDDVTSALLATGDWRAALAAVAARAGADGLAAVKCAVSEILAKSSAQLAAKDSMDKAEAARTQLLHDRAAAFVAEHP